MDDKYNYVFQWHIIFRFYLIKFYLNADFLYQFTLFTLKSPSVIDKTISQENAFKNDKKVAFFRQNDRLK